MSKDDFAWARGRNERLLKESREAERKGVESVIAVADQPTANGDVYTREALEHAAATTKGLRMDGDKLIARTGEESLIKDNGRMIPITDMFFDASKFRVGEHSKGAEEIGVSLPEGDRELIYPEGVKPIDHCGLPNCKGPLICNEPGCEVMHPNRCSSSGKWRCHKHEVDDYHAFKANEIDVRVTKLPGEHAYGFMISRAPMADGSAMMPWCRFKVAAEIVEQARGDVPPLTTLLNLIDDGVASRIERGATYIMSIELPEICRNGRMTEKYADRIASWAEGISKISGATVLPIIFDAGATMKLIEVQPAFNTACELYMLGKFLTLLESILRRDYR